MNAPGSISVVEPVGKALEWTLQVLFRPVDVGKWFIIGFCAWLAFLGESGGGFNFPSGGGHGGGHGGRSGDFRAELERAQDFLMGNLYWIIPVVAFVILLSLALMILFTWLSSRGKFMFLHCVAQNKAEVGGPWNQYRYIGDSLFRFRLALALLGFVVILPLVCLAAFVAFRLFMQSKTDVGLIVLLVGIGLVVFLLTVAFWVLKRVVEDFLVPVMYQREIYWREGWREVAALISGIPGTFLLYLLFRLVLGLATGLIVILFIVCTCCIAGCLMLIPYIGTVLLLPILVFYRSYSAFFLAQFGPQFDVFVMPEETRPTSHSL